MGPSIEGLVQSLELLGVVETLRLGLSGRSSGLRGCALQGDCEILVSLFSQYKGEGFAVSHAPTMTYCCLPGLKSNVSNHRLEPPKP